MSQICNFFTRNFITFQDLKTYNFTIAGISAWGKEAVTTLAVIPEVDRATGYSDNQSMLAAVFTVSIYRGETETAERRWREFKII